MTVKATVIVCSLNFIKSCGAELPVERKSSKEYQWKIPQFFKDETSKIILMADVCFFQKHILLKNHGGLTGLFSNYTCIASKS